MKLTDKFTEQASEAMNLTIEQKRTLRALLYDLVNEIESNYATQGFAKSLPSASEYDDDQRISIAKERYRQAAHAVQTGISFAPDKTGQTSKHLRVGLDLSKSDQAGLAALLISKGVFSMAEYIEAIADQAEIEAEMRAKEIGPNVKLR